MDYNGYALRAAKGMIHSMEYYGNSSPACGDGRVSTPAYYANMLGNALHMRGDSLDKAKMATAGRDVPDWCGWIWLAYAEQLIAEIA
jgi:hypothetical protein